MRMRISYRYFTAAAHRSPRNIMHGKTRDTINCRQVVHPIRRYEQTAAMLDKMTSVSLQLLALLVISHISGLRASLLVDQPPATDTQLPQNGLRSGLLQSRSRRKVPESVDTSPPVEYMTQLRDSLTGSDGNPSTATDDPTSVWCLLDKGINTTLNIS